ncbi:MAG: phosphatidate cytidylyltransferase [Bacteroidia bacterium]|jgi:phosphatidate cytidylyltransferase|nr:phosphatidate cytidylyltransferase [Bacteroidia bacterium]
MAFNLKSFTTRSLSAIVFVVVFLSCVLFSYELFSLFFLMVALLGAKEFMQLSEKLGVTVFKGAVYCFSVLVYINWVKWAAFLPEVPNFLNVKPEFLFAFVPFFFLTLTLFSKSKQPVHSALFSIAAIVYAVVPMCLLHELVFSSTESTAQPLNFNPLVLFGIILLIWSNDTFAYLGGSFFGKRKLLERISPGKTLEGTVFGIAVTFALSAALPHLLSFQPPLPWMILGVVVPVFATLGDLIESMLKRNAGIKDSGNILPGHGGVLDRFDSLLLVSPAVVLMFKLSEF